MVQTSKTLFLIQTKEIQESAFNWPQAISFSFFLSFSLSLFSFLFSLLYLSLLKQVLRFSLWVSLFVHFLICSLERERINIWVHFQNFPKQLTTDGQPRNFFKSETYFSFSAFKKNMFSILNCPQKILGRRKKHQNKFGKLLFK